MLGGGVGQSGSGTATWTEGHGVAGGKRVLLAGESWVMHTIHQKGFDSFTTTAYATGHGWLQQALVDGGWDFTHLPNHPA